MNRPVTLRQLYLLAALAGLFFGVVGVALWQIGGDVLDERDRAIAHDRAQDIQHALEQRRLRKVIVELRHASPQRLAAQLRRCHRSPTCRVAVQRATSSPRRRAARRLPQRPRGRTPAGGGGGPPGNGGPPGGSPAGGGQPPINVKPPTSLPLPSVTVCTPVAGVNC